jgi:hypothetical protein
VASLQWINGNWFALLCVPLVLAAPHVDPRVGRLRNVFYAFYPAHLAVIWVLSQVIAK